MGFSDPWALWLVAPLAAVAVWALVRPARREVVVGSLRLWRQARQALPAAARRRRRRVNIAWLLLLAGGLAGVLACTGWTLGPARQGRAVAVVVTPSAELVDAMPALRQAADALLDQLDPDDRVYVIAPRWSLPDHAATTVASPESQRAVTPARAKEIVATLRPVPMPAATLLEELVPPDDADHVYIIGPPPTPRDSARVSHIPVDADNMDFATAPRILALAAEPLPDDRVQLFVRGTDGGTPLTWADLLPGSARTSPNSPTHTLMALYVFAPPNAPSGSPESPTRLERIATQEWAIGHDQVLLELPARDAYLVALAPVFVLSGDRTDPLNPLTGMSPLAQAGLARRETGRTKIVVVGRDSPLLERLIRVNPGWEHVEDPTDADVVMAAQASPPAAAGGKPVLAIDPPSPPPSWQRGEERGPVLLGQAVVADDPVTAGADLARVGVRRVRPFVPVDTSQILGLPLVRDDGATLILRSANDSPTRRVDVAFDIDPLNTDWGLDASFVVLLSNAVDWLAGQAPTGQPSPRRPSTGHATYEFITPTQAGPATGWHAASPTLEATPLPWPGLYRDGQGQWQGVFIPNIAGPAEQPTTQTATQSPTDIATLPLPAPRSLTEPLNLWPWLLAAAAVLWLGGWWSRQ
ncbi:MAG: BatA domain-containing protein [Phycisphaerae bacterium]|nr:BatA domain-containing protein [Phycisphaerae bacterium]